MSDLVLGTCLVCHNNVPVYKPLKECDLFLLKRSCLLKGASNLVILHIRSLTYPGYVLYIRHAKTKINEKMFEIRGVRRNRSSTYRGLTISIEEVSALKCLIIKHFGIHFFGSSNTTFYFDHHAANYVIIANIEISYEPSNFASLAF